MNGYSLAQKRDEVLAYVAHKHGCSIADLKGPRGKQALANARHEAMWMLRKLGMSYPRIGAILGGRDHSTIVHGVMKHAERTHKDLRPAGEAANQVLRDLEERLERSK